MSRFLGTSYTDCGKIKYVYQCERCKEPTERFRMTNQRVLCFECKKQEQKIKKLRSVIA